MFMDGSGVQGDCTVCQAAGQGQACCEDALGAWNVHDDCGI